MIYTLTFSPSIDYLVFLRNEFEAGRINRMVKDAIYYGGKGVNVSQVLWGLSVENTALGFVAGFTGKEIEAGLNRLGCKTDFVHLKNGHSRINIKLKTSLESEINAVGPTVDSQACEELYKKIEAIGEDDILVVAGAVPDNFPKNFLPYVIEHLQSLSTKFIIDTGGDALLEILPYHPFLIKPNHTELCALFNEDYNPSDIKGLTGAAKHLQEKGARNVMISLGAEGAVLVTEDGQVYSRQAPGGNVVNSVGSGDSMVAGFIAGYLKREDYEDAFVMGIAAGSASAFLEGLASGDEIRQLYRLIR
ncbi:MAG: 1-phosphofructokinase [Lachnospiraceae bacterium]|nr:1-phosphofructokinase [Lachnospiraceae bacterium]HAU99668.1 1-phosphofructokinase [Lachnospiraceae bacterium]